MTKRRREFIGLVGGAVTAWPLAASVQQLPRIGMLYAWAENDSLVQRSLSIFREAFERLGWMDGKNVKIEYRFTNDASRLRLLAEEMATLRPDVIIAHTTPSVVALQRLTATIPIVFISVGNPLASGIVQNLPKPGGNVTGFSNSPAKPPAMPERIKAV